MKGKFKNELDRIKKINISKIIAASAVFITVLVILGWIFNLPNFLRILPKGATMKFNTALLFFILSICLLIPKKRNTFFKILRIGQIFIILFIGSLTLIEYFFDLNFGIDNFFVNDTYSISYPGRMSQASALCFLFIGIALGWINSKSKFRNAIARYALLAITLIAVLAIVGYILRTRTETQFFLESMAIHTSVLFLVLSFVVFLKNPSVGYRAITNGNLAGSKLLRVLLPFIIISPIVLSFLVQYFLQKNLIDYNFGISIYTVTFIFLGIIYISNITTRLNKSDKKRKDLENSLRFSNQELMYFKEAIDKSSIVAITNSKGVITHVNDNFCIISKYEKNELIGKTHSIINSGFHSKEFFKELWETINSGNLWVGELKNKAKDGSYYWVHTSIVPFKNEFGDIYQFLSIRQEITSRKEAEELLSSQYVQTLELKNKELEQFAYIAAHDLQEPLHTVNGFVELLSSEYYGKLDASADKYMKYISDAATRMRFLIKGLLDYSRIGREGDVTVIDLNQLLVEIQENVAFHISETNTIISVDDLPVITGYRSELALLFQNLISNAIKFSKKNIPPKIKISAQKEASQWKFSVEDNGISILDEHKEKIFKIYQRLHNRSEYDGSGIGLAHCQKIVELHGGKIWVDSKPEVGSTFYFTIIN